MHEIFTIDVFVDGAITDEIIDGKEIIDGARKTINFF